MNSGLIKAGKPPQSLRVRRRKVLLCTRSFVGAELVSALLITSFKLCIAPPTEPMQAPMNPEALRRVARTF